MNLRFLTISVIVLASIFLFSCKPQTKQVASAVMIIPEPVSVSEQEGQFELTNKTVIVADGEAKKVAEYFVAKLNVPMGSKLAIAAEAPQANYVSLKIDTSAGTVDEAYKLMVSTENIEISAPSDKGLFYGIQTLLQLLPAEIESSEKVSGVAWLAKCVDITDSPRFPYRGMHLDVCRHFVPVENIKKHLDMMAMLKLNKFHWHLTEDQGWRIEIKAFPKLTEIGSKRTEFDGSIHEGFYTQEQVKEIVKYASDLMIEVIPEIELPGHSLAALTAYPEYSCTGGPFKVRNMWGVEPDVYCAGKEETFEFLNKIIEEVVALFPSEYFHIGGDECPKVRWEKCPLCQKRIKDEGLKNEHELQSYFVQRIEKTLLKHGKKMIGWDEILEGGLAETATVMSWRGEKGGIDAAEQGHDVIMTPGNWCYLDHYQGDPRVEPVGICCYTTLEESYGYEPVPKKLSAEKAKHVQGTQGNVWTEYLYTPELVEYRVYPRIIALAEVNWTSPEIKNFEDFTKRLDNIHERMDLHNINYHIPLPEGPCNNFVFVDTAKLEFTTSRPIKMVYTLDNSEPNAESKEYTEPIVLTENATIKIASVLPTGKMSKVRTIKVEKQEYAKAKEVETGKSGLLEKYAEGKFPRVADLEKVTEWETIENAETIKSTDVNKPSVSILTGYIDIPEKAVYEFGTDVDQLFIDDKLLISNDGEVKRFSRNNTMIALDKGKHAIKIVFINNITGGCPSVWFGAKVLMRKSGDKKFTQLTKEHFSY